MARAQTPGVAEPNHALRFGLIWIVSSLIATPLVVLLLGPIMPPGNGSEQASGHVTDNTVLIGMATPVLLLVVIYLIYAIVYFRQPKGAVAGRSGDSWQRAHADDVDRDHLDACWCSRLPPTAPCACSKTARARAPGRTRSRSRAGPSCRCR